VDDELGRTSKAAIVTSCRYCPCIYREGLRKSIKNLIHDNPDMSSALWLLQLALSCAVALPLGAMMIAVDEGQKTNVIKFSSSLPITRYI
jgi:hypothetical protein